jgi:hypothetical protein
MTFQRLGALLGVAALSVAVIACGEDTTTSPQMDVTPAFGNGNGAPTGAHFNLNLIGVPKNKTADMTGDNGRRIFVPLHGNTKILLYEGDFAVGDANGTDGTASFYLPDPGLTCYDPDGPTDDDFSDDLCYTSAYSVYARALGPGGSATLQTCADEDGDLGTTDDTYCSTESKTFTPVDKKFHDVSKYLLTLYLSFTVDADNLALANCLVNGNVEEGDEVNVRIGLFDDCLQQYFWDYTNNGLKLLQLRFYEQPSEVFPYEPTD